MAEAGVKPTAETKPLANGKIPIAFEVGGKVIDGATVRPLSFQGFADVVLEASNLKQPKSWDARMKRLRLLRQVTFYNDSTAVAISVEELLQMPIPAARVLSEKIDEDNAKPGKVIREGDGIDQAITFELGTPIPAGQGKKPISELEFLAKTYGDIEDVMAANDSITQTSLLIATVAKPLGTTLSQLPSWAVGQITIADGLAISRQILPHFLGSPDES